MLLRTAAKTMGALATLGIVNDCVHIFTAHLSPLAIVVLSVLAVVAGALGMNKTER